MQKFFKLSVIYGLILLFYSQGVGATTFFCKEGVLELCPSNEILASGPTKERQFLALDDLKKDYDFYCSLTELHPMCCALTSVISWANHLCTPEMDRSSEPNGHIETAFSNLYQVLIQQEGWDLSRNRGVEDRRLFQALRNLFEGGYRETSLSIDTTEFRPETLLFEDYEHEFEDDGMAHPNGLAERPGTPFPFFRFPNLADLLLGSK